MDQFHKNPINFKEDTVLWNKIISKPGDIKNFICLMVKQYIYRQRCLKQSLNYYELIDQIYLTRNMEKYIARKNSKEHLFYRKWYNIEEYDKQDTYEIEYILQK